MSDKREVLDLVPVGTAQLERAQKTNTVFSGGIKGGSFLPTLSFRGRQFRIKSGKNDEVSLDSRTLDVIMVTARADVSKAYYEGKFVAGQAGKGPTCKSANGVTPDADVVNKQSSTCATCRMNAWGSKINETTGKEGKACGDHKVIIFAPPTLDGDKPLQCQLPAMSLQNLGVYIKLLDHNGLAANEVITQLKFTDGDAFPKLEFKYAGSLNADEIAKVAAVAAREDVLATVRTPEKKEEQSGSEQKVVVQVKATAPDPTVAPSGGPATQTATEDNPTDEVSSILSRWGAKGK